MYEKVTKDNNDEADKKDREKWIKKTIYKEMMKKWGEKE